MSLPVAWSSRTNSSAPENAVKSERPGDWTHATITSKYRIEDLEQGEGAPLGWGKRANTKTLEELSLSPSASTVAVAEVHVTRAAPGSIFREPQAAREATLAARTAAPTATSTLTSASASAPAAYHSSPAPSSVGGEALAEVRAMAQSIAALQQALERQAEAQAVAGDASHNLLTALAGAVLRLDVRLGGIEAKLGGIEAKIVGAEQRGLGHGGGEEGGAEARAGSGAGLG